MDFAVIGFIITHLLVIGAGLVSITKLYSRVAQLESEREEIKLLRNDVQSIKVSLTRIETTLEIISKK